MVYFFYTKTSIVSILKKKVILEIMKSNFVIIIVSFLVFEISFSQSKKTQKHNLDKILVEFIIPNKQVLNVFKTLRTADEYFYSANKRTKKLEDDLDSSTIYIAIKEYQSSIKLDNKYWAAYRNLSRLFL